MSDNESFHFDDFEDMPENQPSGYIHVSEAPDLSQEAWYDIEDDAGGSGFNTTYSASTKKYPSSGTTGSSAQNSGGWGMPAGSSTTPWIASSKSVLRSLLSIRGIIVVVALLTIISGVALAKDIVNPPAKTKPVTTTLPKATPIPTRPVPTVVTATPMPVQPTMPVQPAPIPGLLTSLQNLPASWKASNHSDIDAIEAMDVASTFTQRYYTIDYRSLATLSAARFILTPSANARFTANDRRSTDAFAEQVKQEKLKQAAIITGAQIVKAEKHNGCFFTWVTVSYQLYAQEKQGMVSMKDNLKLNVLLVSAPFGTPVDAPPMGGVGFLVSNFQEGGDTLAPIPTHP